MIFTVDLTDIYIVCSLLSFMSLHDRLLKDLNRLSNIHIVAYYCLQSILIIYKTWRIPL